MSAHARYGIPNVAPVVGMPATVCIGSDRYPAIVTAVAGSSITRPLSIALCLRGGDGTIARYVASREQQGVYDDADGNGRRAYVGRADSYRDPHA